MEMPRVNCSLWENMGNKWHFYQYRCWHDRPIRLYIWYACFLYHLIILAVGLIVIGGKCCLFYDLRLWLRRISCKGSFHTVASWWLTIGLFLSRQALRLFVVPSPGWLSYNGWLFVGWCYVNSFHRDVSILSSVISPDIWFLFLFAY